MDFQESEGHPNLKSKGKLSQKQARRAKKLQRRVGKGARAAPKSLKLRSENV